MSSNNTAIATFAAGCFWCVEAQFKNLKGVTSLIPGYIGGDTKNPTYEEVCSGTTGHAEAMNIYFNPELISYEELLAAFFTAHDPTQLNRQGNDIGTQYRSAIFYHDEEQKTKANFYIQQLNELKAYPDPIVTEVSAYDTFYEAEAQHRDYYSQNPNQGYCQMVIKPKVEHFKRVFEHKLK